MILLIFLGKVNRITVEIKAQEKDILKE